MISQQSYSPAWIESFKRQRQYRTVNPALFEKMIYAFSLLELLAGTGLDFIFKGGTSLMLMPIGSDRFSIDIDIVTSQSKAELDNVLKRLIAGSAFTNFHKDEGRFNKNGIPKAHYSFDFAAIANRDGNIVLDVLFEENPYASIIRAEIRNTWIDTKDPYLLVNIPSVNSILGDKLTAFAPTTTGVKYWLGNPDAADKRIEIIKQLHDVSKLIDYCSDIVETKDVFQRIARHQIAYRSQNIEVENVIDDIFETALILAKRERNRKEPDLSRFADLQSGLSMFKEYLITGSFRIEAAIIASAKAACFTQAFHQDISFSFQLFNESINMADWNISNPEFNFLNRFKRTNKAAFFYWYKCLELKNLIDIGLGK